jgi:hypothetical protein
MIHRAPIGLVATHIPVNKILRVLLNKKTIKEVPDGKSSSTFVCSNDITTRSDWTSALIKVSLPYR